MVIERGLERRRLAYGFSVIVGTGVDSVVLRITWEDGDAKDTLARKANPPNVNNTRISIRSDMQILNRLVGCTWVAW